MKGTVGLAFSRASDHSASYDCSTTTMAQFFASLMTFHRPNLLSCPSAATSMTPGGPLLAEARLLTLPVPFAVVADDALVNVACGRGRSWMLLTKPRAGMPSSAPSVPVVSSCPFAGGCPLRAGRGERGCGCWPESATGANERRSSAMRHSRICPSQLPDANRSAYGSAASDVIHRGAWSVPSVSECETSTPCARGWLKMGFFFVVDQSEMVLLVRGGRSCACTQGERRAGRQ